MRVYTESVERLIEELSALPGVGRKTAERYAFHILRSSEEDVLRLAAALRDVKSRIRLCSRCYQMTETDPCSICSDPRRDPSVLCVVEQPHDVIALEKIGSYHGLYHVLLGRISPLDDTAAADLTVQALLDRVAKGDFREVILATNPTLEGEGTALFLAKELARVHKEITITRLARGMPSGGSIEFVSCDVLADALEGRKPLKGATPE
ncbi:MAG: recombination mediator RecR [Planctomycetota bacterium]